MTATRAVRRLSASALLLCLCAYSSVAQEISGELRHWHPVTLTFEGPELSEEALPNPFRRYRLSAAFTHTASGTTTRVPGYFAADGEAAESSASRGSKWRVHFTPDRTGEYTYSVSFRRGPDVALSPDRDAGSPAAFDGASGSFEVSESNKTGRDHRSKGFLKYAGERYLRFSNDDYFLKGGTDSPENFLAYADFDGTYDIDGIRADSVEARSGEATAGDAPGEGFLHHYEPHVKDWRPGDPTWKDDRGRGIIGALNYLANQEMNSVYFLTMNVTGDGNDVWPWTRPDVHDRFDVSKLAQWNIVFDHMDARGLMLHVITQEQENDQLLDGGDLGPQRKLYYRELIARFSHHLALTWNLGEENTNTTEQRKAFASYIRGLDPYDHPIVVHTFPGAYEEIYEPLLGFPDFTGPSLQMGDMTQTHGETLRWIEASAETAHPWVVSLDEIGPAHTGVKPDGPDDNHAAVRNHALWGNLMAGGAGAEWYFGYDYPHNDLNAEDWRSRRSMWAYTRHALRFFHEHLPFSRMHSADDLTPADDDYVLASEGEIYAVYRPNASIPSIEIDDGTYLVRWYNPRTGGPLQSGNVSTIEGPGVREVGSPPTGGNEDWVVLVRREN